jgi:DNA-binding transcriptional LysR family regulator
LDRIQAMRVFVRIVERGSFAQAARDLLLPRPTVTHIIQRLEADLGVRLLERTTRSVRPTLDGSAYHHRCVRLLADLEEMESAFRDVKPRGPLRVDMQGTMARFFVLPALPEFMQRYPDIALRMSEGDRMVDLIAEGVDCVLRAGDLSDSSLVGRKLGAFAQVTCASPGYFAKAGVPESLSDLNRHKMVGYAASTSGQPYPLEFMVNGKLTEVQVAFDLLVSGAEVYTASGVAGLGLIQVPRYRIAHQIDAGLLQVVLENVPPPDMAASILYPQNRQMLPRVRVFVEWLVGLFTSVSDSGQR